MSKVFAFCNQKGGVGKTTSVVNISTVLASLKYKVLVVDLDPQGNTTSGFGIDKTLIKKSTYDVIINDLPLDEALVRNHYDHLDVLPGLPSLAGAEIELVQLIGREFQLKEKVEPILKNYHAILIDCPPSLGLLTINALAAATEIIIPLQCEFYALEGLSQLLTTFRLIKTKVNSGLEIGGMILTMADSRTNLAGQVIENVRKHFPEKMFQTVIPRSVKLSEAPSFGMPGVIYAEGSKGAESYIQLTKEFIAAFLLDEELDFGVGGEKFSRESRETRDDSSNFKATPRGQSIPTPGILAQDVNALKKIGKEPIL